MRLPIVIAVPGTLLIALVVGVGMRFVNTQFSLLNNVVIQIAFGMFCFWVGRTTHGPGGLRSKPRLGYAITLVAALALSGLLSPMGDPYSFALGAFMELPFAAWSCYWGQHSASRDLGEREA